MPSRCAGRCLKRLNLAVNYDEAQSQCDALGAHLAVPRSDEENQCAIDAAGANIVWLGFNDVVTENQFVADDGCGPILSAESEIDCGLLCEGATPEECSGFIYGPDDGTCRLFSGDCRGPAVNSSQLNTERYMARSTCTGKLQ
ncbi:hypothetical protein FJT64_015334 [Amphibalanus amphitrite]|uniref:C-type lectin domain-containing protein n=1 Tax=Amphibalanus amphitrite TaxID=1232801 RepID=A0A6A4XH22_AMPAM|nr:hypothetical protein FJT64_015334 [Amphibalanus amphitrite]